MKQGKNEAPNDQTEYKVLIRMKEYEKVEGEKTKTNFMRIALDYWYYALVAHNAEQKALEKMHFLSTRFFFFFFFALASFAFKFLHYSLGFVWVGCVWV